VSIVVVLLTLIIWWAVFFYPYAKYLSSYSYARGSEPDFLSSAMFALVVAVGNELTCIVVTFTVNKVGFWCQDTIETTYLVFYAMACFLSMLGDLAVTCFLSYKTMVGMNAHTHSGKLLVDLPTVRAVLESYPMQKALGRDLFLFAFPSCFLVPFVLEPVLTIFMPFHISRLLVGTNSKFRGRAAEKCLKFFIGMELARYADIILNMMLATFVFFFPTGYTLKMFGALLGCHIYIILLDHYRVLRCVEGFNFSTQSMDFCANIMMSVPCGLLLACTVFKTFRLPSMEDAVSEWTLLALCLAAFFVHISVHVILLCTLVPRLGKVEHNLESDQSYEAAAHRLPCGWFTANPIHCLRSQYFYQHYPPCVFYIRGKEHLMTANPDIGIYYQAQFGKSMHMSSQFVSAASAAKSKLGKLAGLMD
jgi:hypothetical protein